ncbi:transglycosylase SLT domain-containing protein [Comamonas endophytica]|uniref:Transglycosylase SLT domain-containing protein n=1 Tax=Comamonas endophytica TaxID=2949090 RepID=A0ABY6GAR3_9BURK|nr:MULTISPECIES: transglycosylase SLT domain-containing protein [unclassified Acidovorax]MCD2513851.1 transglycosylase SLT domain-containing protein [Acidovorax sp. D4N7]UYG52149.1 transglycosylase SLT domain-containing protein [Acidovorax sp. 5MLIR]
MKLLYPALLSSVLWLAGCATVTPDGSASDAGASLSHTPQYPNGSLSPLQTTELTTPGVASLSAPADLWDRIRRGFAMPDLEHELVHDREQWYSSRPDYILRMTERSSKYLFHIVEELERRGMPTELALLPYIESAFNPQAVSSAKAAGMWQFMPATGTYFDLKQNIFRDDRRDVLASTRAALDYLQKLYGMFGDWHLALAAYNWGEGSVGRAIARNRKAGLGISYSELNMPAETRLYVPKLQAVKNIVNRPDVFSAELPLIENHPYFQTVDITRDIDVELAAKLADVSVADFRALNPSLSRPVIFAAGTPQILLPWDNAKVFQRNLAAYDKGQYSSWTVWTAPSTLTAADAAQRVGMSEEALRTLNSIPPRMLIKAGSALMVPRTASTLTDVSSQVADNGYMSLAPEIVTRRTTVKAQKRDTLASLARRHRVSVANLADWNDMNVNSAIKAGQSIVLFVPLRGTSVTPSRTRAGKVAVAARSNKAPAATSKKGGTPSKVKKR